MLIRKINVTKQPGYARVITNGDDYHYLKELLRPPNKIFIECRRRRRLRVQRRYQEKERLHKRNSRKSSFAEHIQRRDKLNLNYF